MKCKLFGPALDTNRATAKDASISTTPVGIEVASQKDGRHIFVQLGRGGVVTLARVLISNVEFGHMEDVDVHDLKHIERTIRMLITSKENP